MVTTKRRSPLISAAELDIVTATQLIVLIDARAGADAKKRYNEAHLENAIYVDLEKDLSTPVTDASNGGRHPLPPVNDFAVLLGKLGIDPTTHVVVYDDKSGANAASRFWWMLKALGHQNVQVLDGGLAAALKQGLKTTSLTVDPVAGPAYPASKWNLSTVDINKVEEVVTHSGWMVIDVREAYRYRGESEPIDLTAGHIPGAVNIPYPENLDKEGNFLSPAELADKYKSAIGDRATNHVIVHCGSGVTACHTLLAMEQAGIEGAQLYVGSWSEWSRTERPIATE